MRFSEAEVDEEEKKEVAKDAMIGGNNHKTSFGQFLSDQMSKGKVYDSIATVGESQVWWRADFQSGSRVLKKVF